MRMVNCVKMNPDLSRLATGSTDGTARVWWRDAAGRFAPESVLAGHEEGTLVPVDWSSDSRQLVTGDGDGKLRVYDAPNWSAPRATIDVGGRGVTSLSIRASDGLVLAGCYDGGIRVVDVSTGRVERTLLGTAKPIYSLSWSPSGTHFASGDKGDMAAIWSESTWEVVHVLRSHGGSMRWSPDSSRVLTACWDKKVRIFSASTGEVERTMEGRGMAAQLDADWSPDGTLVASVGEDKVVRVWDARSGALVRSLAGHAAAIHGVDWTRGDLIVTCGDDNSIRLWDVSSLVVATAAPPTTAVSAATLSPAPIDVAPPTEDFERSDSVFVGNLPYSVTEDQLYDAFSSAGEIKAVRMARDRDSGNFLGFAFVDFASVEAATNAVYELNEFDMRGRSIRISFAREDGDRGRGGFRGRGRGGDRGGGRGGRGGTPWRATSSATPED